MHKKTYVETGALDGRCGSRSLSLAEDLDYFGILVEPSPASYVECEANRKNQNTNTYNCALVPFSYNRDTVDMFVSTVHPGMNTCSLADTTNLITHGYTGEAIQVPARTLQSILDENDITVIEEEVELRTIDDTFQEETQFDLIKIDTQGAELDILEGGPKIAKKAKGILLEVSYTKYNEGAPLYDDVVTYMSDYGFVEKETIDEISCSKDREGFDLLQRDLLFINKNIL